MYYCKRTVNPSGTKIICCPLNVYLFCLWMIAVEGFILSGGLNFCVHSWYLFRNISDTCVQGNRCFNCNCFDFTKMYYFYLWQFKNVYLIPQCLWMFILKILCRNLISSMFEIHFWFGLTFCSIYLCHVIPASHPLICSVYFCDWYLWFL